MKAISSILIAVILALACGPAAAGETPSPRCMVVRVPVPTGQVPDLISRDLDVLSLRGGVAEIRVSPTELDQLRADGWPCVVLDENIYETIARREAAATSSDEPWTSYHDLAGVHTFLTGLHASYPDISALETIGISIEGRDIVALRISDDAAVVDHDEPATLFLGCHHAREWISVEVPLYLAEHLLTNYDTDLDIRRYVDSSEIWVVPVLNPDGYRHSQTTNRMWRKNRRDNGDGTFGVDLNRNYSYEWGEPGSSGYPSWDTYRGTAPFSEPETQAVRDLFEGQDGREFEALITYHNYGQLVLYPWGYTYDPPPDVNLLSGMASTIADLINDAHADPQYDYIDQQGAILYPTNGDTTDWAYGVHGVPAFTIELRPVDWPHGGFELPPEQILPTCQENLPAALFLIDWAIPKQPGDFDLDGDVDQEDFGRFQACLTDSGSPQDDPACGPARLDADADVDQDDLVIFRGCMSGANVEADPGCAGLSEPLPADGA